MHQQKGTDNPRPDKVWGGYGENKPCHVCARPIGTTEVKIDVEAGADAEPLLFHQQCYDVWTSWAPG